MKKAFSTLSLSCLFFCLTALVPNALLAQVTVQTQAVVGGSPTSCTTTSLLVTGNLNMGGYTFVGNIVTVTGLNLTVDVEYSFSGIGIPVITPFTQTVTLGTLAPGTYNLTVNGVFNGANTSSLTGTIIVTSCCPAIPSFTSSNTAVCEGDNVSFTNTSTGATSYFWKDNGVQFSTALNPIINLTGGGVHTIELVVTDGSCFDSTAQAIMVYADPNINFGPDTNICSGNPLILNPGSGFSSYLWSGNSTNQTLSVFIAGTYSVIVSDSNGCDWSGAINVLSVAPSPSIDLGPDSFLCENVQITLDPGAGFQSYLWSDNSTGQTVMAGAGIWTCTVFDGVCIGVDTINIGQQAPVNADLGADTTVCGEYLLGSTNTFQSYLWSNGNTTNEILITASGPYAVTVSDANMCEGVDSIEVIILPVPPLDLGVDTVICPGMPIVLNAFSANSTYMWQNNLNFETFMVTIAGQFWVEVTGANGCIVSDTINIEPTICSSVEELEGTSLLKVYPNPSNGTIQLEMLGNISTNIEVVNIQGKVVKLISLPENASRWEIDLSELTEGMYFLQFSNADQTFSKKLILE